MRRILDLFRKEPNTKDALPRLELDHLAQVAGVTTFAKTEVEAVLNRRKVGKEWYAELDGVLRKDEHNPVDRQAVNVMVDGVRFGCLPSYLSAALELNPDEVIPCTVQVFVRDISQKRKVAAWVWFGSGAPEWEWSRNAFPPMTTEERSTHDHARSKAVVTKALAEGGRRAEEFKRGMVHGVHYLELYEPIKQLKREGKLEDALALCYQAIEGAENDRDGSEPAPAYTLEAAIIHRKLGQRNEEIAVLKRWMKLCPKDRREGSRVAVRLEKLTGL